MTKLFRLVISWSRLRRLFGEMNRILFSLLIGCSWQYRNRTKGGERLKNGTWGGRKMRHRDFPCFPTQRNKYRALFKVSLHCDATLGKRYDNQEGETATLARLITDCHENLWWMLRRKSARSLDSRYHFVISLKNYNHAKESKYERIIAIDKSN